MIALNFAYQPLRYFLFRPQITSYTSSFCVRFKTHGTAYLFILTLPWHSPALYRKKLWQIFSNECHWSLNEKLTLILGRALAKGYAWPMQSHYSARAVCCTLTNQKEARIRNCRPNYSKCLAKYSSFILRYRLLISV